MSAKRQLSPKIDAMDDLPEFEVDLAYTPFHKRKRPRSEDEIEKQDSDFLEKMHQYQNGWHTVTYTKWLTKMALIITALKAHFLGFDVKAIIDSALDCQTDFPPEIFLFEFIYPCPEIPICMFNRVVYTTLVEIEKELRAKNQIGGYFLTFDRYRVILCRETGCYY